MSSRSNATTRLSTKGQLILPKAIRQRRQWAAGTELIVEDTPDGVLIKAASYFPPKRVEDVAGSLRYDGPAISIEDMNRAVLDEAKRRLARD